MKKLYINSRKYAKPGSLILGFITLLILYRITTISDNGQANTLEYWSYPVVGFALVLLIGKSHFLYRTLERTNDSTLTFYNNFFGFKLNSSSITLDQVDSIRTFQDSKNFYVIELQLRNGTTFQLGRFAVKSHLTPFEQLANELIKT